MEIGNTSEDTEGCILVGMTKSEDFIGNSKMAFSRLMDRISGMSDMTITIERTA